jgi:UDP-GlcNAc3NAcA epimerase
VIRAEKLPVPGNVRAVDPVGYFDILMLEVNADAILTDSGGMQKEAYWAGVRCLTLRAETEWVETVAAGWNRLVGIDPDSISEALANWFPAGERPEIYGDGRAAQKIAKILSG